MSSNVEHAYFTTGNAVPAICGRCEESFAEGDLYFLQDKKPDGREKYVCGDCRKYYREKTEARDRELTMTSGLFYECPCFGTVSKWSPIRPAYFCFKADHSGDAECGQPPEYS
jgi:hypothetical protein